MYCPSVNDPHDTNDLNCLSICMFATLLETTHGWCGISHIRLGGRWVLHENLAHISCEFIWVRVEVRVGLHVMLAHISCEFRWIRVGIRVVCFISWYARTHRLRVRMGSGGCSGGFARQARTHQLRARSELLWCLLAYTYASPMVH